MIDLKGIIKEFLTNNATYILNRPGIFVENNTPYEDWFGKKCGINHLRIIGGTCYTHAPKSRRKKVNKRDIKCRLTEYDNTDGPMIQRI